jgi:hypothetical protein
MPHLLTNEVNMDPDFRAKVVNARGFCNRHMHLLYNTAYTPGSQDGLGYALYMLDVVKTLAENVQSVRSSIINVNTSGSRILRRREFAKLLKQAIMRLENNVKGTEECPACEYLKQLDALRRGTLIRMLDEDVEFREIFSKSRGFCIPHFMSLVKTASDTKIKHQEIVLNLIFEVESKNIERLQTLLKKFIERFDWRREQKSYGEEVEANTIVKSVLKGVEGLRI